MAFIKIDKNNFFHNLNQIALKTGSVEKIAIVLKDNAYGHGLTLMAKLASEFGIQHAVVRTNQEAEQIASLFETILILCDKITVHPKFYYAVNALEDIAQAPKGANIELKIDTGMHRNGIAVDALGIALESVGKQGLHLKGVMTHYRSADVLSSELFWQQKLFDAIKQQLKSQGYEQLRIHSCNSAALLRTASFSEDLARVGIAAYGYHDLPALFDAPELKPVLSLYAKRVSTRTLQKSQRIGYGGTWQASKETYVSTYDLGYGDGWHRASYTEPYITAEGLPILGRVSMDLISLESQKEQICVMDNAQNAAKQLGTICYEILTALKSDIPREVI